MGGSGQESMGMGRGSCREEGIKNLEGSIHKKYGRLIDSEGIYNVICLLYMLNSEIRKI